MDAALIKKMIRFYLEEHECKIFDFKVDEDEVMSLCDYLFINFDLETKTVTNDMIKAMCDGWAAGYFYRKTVIK